MALLELLATEVAAPDIRPPNALALDDRDPLPVATAGVAVADALRLLAVLAELISFF